MILSIFHHPKPYYKHAPTLIIFLITLWLNAPPLVSAQFLNNFQVGSNPIVAGVVLTIATVFVFAMFTVLNFCCQSQGENQARADDGPGQRARKGLDPSVIESFPVLKYSEVVAHQTQSDSLECAVCLSQFEHCEQLRLLPKCNHVFHVECLDPWLKDHSTCPLCRIDLVPETIELDQIELDLTNNGPEGEVNEGGNDGNNNVTEVRVDIEEGHLGKFKRWKSTGHVAYAEMVEGECWKKFTLTLPEKEMMKFGEVTSKFQRSRSSI